MKLAVSNIAWPDGCDDDAFGVLREGKIDALEIAPTRFWPDWGGIGVEPAKRKAAELHLAGFRIPSLQALLFAKPDCKLFGTDAERERMFDHLMLCADIAEAMGANRLVFGAPKNRDLRGRSAPEAYGIAKEFFAEVAGRFASRHLALCLEPNPSQYGCNFMVKADEAAGLVYAVDNPGLRLHLDTACMLLAGDDAEAAIRDHHAILGHFHVSEPYLGGFEEPRADHRRIREALESASYSGYVALEMRAATPPLPGLRTAVGELIAQYAALSTEVK